MSTIHVVAKRDFLESLTIARPMAALAELVWNGFDAQSDWVHVHLDMNRMGGLETIRVRDAGYGINHAHVSDLFGSLGDSWKRRKTRQDGRALHGKSGKGRFRAFALGTLVEWNTTFRGEDGKSLSYRIRGQAASLDDFDIFDPVDANGAPTGTEVVISNLKSEFGSLLKDDAPLELGKLFAAFLTQYPALVLEYKGTRVDPAHAQTHLEEYDLGDVELSGSQKAPVAVTVVEWSIPTDRTLHLCDASGVTLHETPTGQQIRAPGFNFTAYVKADRLRELDQQNQLVLEDLHPDVLTLVGAARNIIKDHFRRRLLEDQGKAIERWRNERIYPYADKANLDPIERAERQVFDILAVNLETYLPSFEEADAKSRKFTFRLLAQAVRENPDSVQEIMGEVLGLKKEAQHELAELLRRTPLSSILTSARITANRLDFLTALENLLSDKASKKQLLERSQLHRILERDAWLFDEQFALASSEPRLEAVLHKHLAILGTRQDEIAPAKPSAGKTGGMDLTFHKVVQPRKGEYEYLIVELKRPTKVIDGEVLTQVRNYARAVAADEQFQGIPARWTFLAIANELDDVASGESHQPGRRGKVSEDEDLKVTVWVKTWAEVINDARTRLGFVHEQLVYEADRDRATSYLRKTHARFIPLRVAPGGVEARADDPGARPEGTAAFASTRPLSPAAPR